MRYRWLRGQLIRAHETIVAGTIFEPTEAELRAFPDFLQQIDDPADGAQVPPGQAYGLVERPGGWWDVVRPDGRRVTPTALRRRDAEALLRDLQAQDADEASEA